MALYDIAQLRAVEADLKFRPSIVSYSRIEPLCLTSGDLTPGLEVPIADPLWMLGRQWQFEELRGEDAGSPVVAEVVGERAPVTRFRPGPASAGLAAVDVEPGTPFEVAVEAELPAVLPDRVRLELGQQLVRLTRASGLPVAGQRKAVAAYLAQWPFPVDDPLPDGMVEEDPAGAARRRLLGPRVPDGAAAAASGSLPAAVLDAVAAGQQAMLSDVFDQWRAWARAYLVVPAGESWDPRHLEYAFAAQATLSTGDVVLRADEYAGGTLDWYSFDAASAPSLGPAGQPVAPDPIHKEAIPTPVSYPGMPNDRLWAFEDAHVYLGGVKAGSTDLARLALVEFSLVFSTDWFMVPIPMRYGDVARVDKVTVTDTFGKVIDIAPSREVSRPGWTVFQNTPVDDGSWLADVFVLPATVRHALQGPPLEEVALFRDEMANLVWGVERIVQGARGEPVKRGLAESRTLRQPMPTDLGDAAIVYRLMTPVPDHWQPFVSVPVPGVPLNRFATELQRRPMIRLTDPPSLSHPRGVLLRADPSGPVADDQLRIAEEEVPRDGVVVTRRFQLARTLGGGTVLWVGRCKQTGQGEGASGLKFDTALPPGAV
ncbi:MAG TPA: hypothetical protein VFK52_13080 [Nocardioidaceae bacterium]|nr:hypothetical protein [Nocardioidaceae bacterium]